MIRFSCVSMALLGSAVLASACSSGSSSPTAGSAPAVVPTFQAAAATPAISPVDRVEGTVKSIDGNTVTLREGGTFVVSDQTKVNRGLPALPTDLVPGKVVAVAAKMQTDNTLLASAISIYAIAPSPTFFRQYPLDHQNLMTNATIDSGSGNAFTVAFAGGGGAKVGLAPDAKIITITAATSTDLTAGASITALVLNGVAQVVSIL